MKLYVSVVLVLMANILFSQTMWDNALPIRQSGDLEWNQSSITTEDNEIIHVWSEKNNGVRDILAMKFDIEGNSLWGQDPIVVAESDNNQFNAKIITTNDEGVVVIWLDQDYLSGIRAQKLDASGNRLWSDEGVFISNQYDVDLPHRVVLFPNEIGGAIISWNNYDTMAQSLDNNGLAQWDEDGLNVGYTSYNNQVISDGYGGLIIVDTEEDPYIMTAKRIDSTGEILWDEDFELELMINDKRELRIIYNNIDSYYFMQEEFDYLITNIAVKKISLTGELGTTTGYFPIMNGTIESYNLDYTTNANGDLFVVSQSLYYYLDSFISLRGFQLDSDLNHVWDESGVLLDTYENFTSDSIHFVGTDSGELFLTKVTTDEESPYNDYFNINLYKINADGTIQTDEGGLLLAQSEVNGPIPYLSYEDDLFIVWSEFVDGYRNLRQNMFDDAFQNITPENNEVVRHSLTGNISQTEYISYTLPNSEMSVTIWLDKKTGMNNKIKYQIVNSDGNVEFAENGIDIADFTYDGIYEYDISSFNASQNNSGQICVVWESALQSAIGRSRIIDTDGSLLGSNTGQEIFPNSLYDQVSNLSISSYNNEFYLSYMVRPYYGNEKTVYSSKTNNISEWGQANLIDSYTGSAQGIFEIDKVINNYCVVKKNNQLYNIFKIADDGSVSEINQMLYGYEHKFDCDAENNLFYTWYSAGKIYVQGITDTNQLYWNDPIQVSYEGAEDNIQAKYPEILVTGEINIVWSQASEVSDFELRAQKINFTGEKLWPESGVLLSTMVDYVNVSLLEEISEGNIIAGWSEYDNDYFIYKLNMISSEGDVVYDENSSIITGNSQDYYTLKLTNLPNNQLFTTWYSEGGLYAQVVDFTTVDNESNDITPINMNLLQNYPNPFNPETNISFLVPNSGQVNLDIYNIKGQKVKTLVNDKFNAGRHSVVWNGKDDSNKQVASGIYLYKMRSGEYTSTKKMILIK